MPQFKTSAHGKCSGGEFILQIRSISFEAELNHCSSIRNSQGFIDNQHGSLSVNTRKVATLRERMVRIQHNLHNPHPFHIYHQGDWIPEMIMSEELGNATCGVFKLPFTPSSVLVFRITSEIPLSEVINKLIKDHRCIPEETDVIVGGCRGIDEADKDYILNTYAQPTSYEPQRPPIERSSLQQRRQRMLRIYASNLFQSQFNVGFCMLSLELQKEERDDRILYTRFSDTRRFLVTKYGKCRVEMKNRPYASFLTIPAIYEKLRDEQRAKISISYNGKTRHFQIWDAVTGDVLYQCDIRKPNADYRKRKRVSPA